MYRRSDVKKKKDTYREKKSNNNEIVSSNVLSNYTNKYKNVMNMQNDHRCLQELKG